MMGGGGGGGRSYFPDPKKLGQLVEEARAVEARKKLDAEVNEFLRTLLTGFNDRDVERTQAQLEALLKLLEKGTEIDQILLGGSVSKHTYVDGLSDVDALVMLADEDLAERGPHVALKRFFRTLDNRLTRDTVLSVEKGDLAVTVKYRDGSEVQLLPALRSGKKILIPDETGKRWKETNPRVFQEALTSRNAALNQQLVPAIKLFKAAIAGLPKQKQLNGYHAEALALEATEAYTGQKTMKAVLLHMLDAASRRVLKPIRDITGQSQNVDEYLGRENSLERRNVGQALAGLARRLSLATELQSWRHLFED